MRAFLRLFSLLAACIATSLPGEAGAQRRSSIPPLYVAPVYTRTDAGPPDTVGLRIRVAEAPGRGREREPVAPSTQIAQADAARILARLPALSTSAAAADSFAFPARTLAAPRTGRVRLASFPPPDTAPPPRPAGPRQPAALTLVRAAPRGEVPVGAEVSITFSQAMVPLSSVGTVEAGEPPVRLSPQPAGSWRWIDVRTLVFTAEGRMPAATEYTVTIPAGTRSAAGGALAEEARWTFSTPRLSATGGYPHGEAVRLEPLIIIQFDQRIDRAALLPHVAVTAEGQPVAIRPATEAEIAADSAGRMLRARGESVHWIALRPVRPLPKHASVQVAVRQGAPSAEGPLGTSLEQSWSFRTYAPLRLAGASCGGERNICRPGNPFYLTFNNPLDTAAFRPAQVRVEPSISGMAVLVTRDGVVITGHTRPHTRYTVRIGADVRDVFGQTLEAPQQRTFDVAAPFPGLIGFEQRMMVLDPVAPPRLSVSSHDHARLRIRIHRVEPSDWPAFQRYRPRTGLPGRQVVNRIADVGGEPGEVLETEIDLREVLGGRPGQLIVGVEAVDGEGADQASYVWVQSTRIGLAAFADREEVTAWATSLVDGAPLSGVRISVSRGAVEATTDARGTALLRDPGRPRKESVESFLVAERDGDRALLPAALRYPRDGGPAVLWYSLTDRNLYRPGEEVRFKGWVRRFERSKDGGVELPRTTTRQVQWRVRDPRGNEIATGTAPLTSLGGFDGVFRLPPGSNLGHGNIELRLAGETASEAQGWLGFLVQEFRRPEYETSIDAPAGPHVVGGGTEVSVRAAYFAGGGLPGAPVEWTLTSMAAHFTPPGWGAWRFGVAPEYGWGRARPQVASTRTFEGRTDADGRHALRVDFDAADPPGPHTLAINATVTDVNRQPWTSSAQLLVHPADVYVGLRTERAWLTAGEPIELGVVAVDLDGKPVAGRTVQVLAERLQWRQGPEGWSEVAVDSARCTVVSEASPVSCTISTHSQGGTYRVTADTRDERGRPSRTRMSVWSWGASPWRGGPGEEANAQRVVRLVPDREEYAPGDTARILVQLPFWPARGLVTVRREGIVRTIPIESEGPGVAVSVPVTEGDIPNLHVQADVVGAYDREGQRQPTARGTDFASGTVSLRVPPGPRTLRVTAAPVDSVLAPDSPGAVDVRVLDAAGRPVGDAEVAVVMVDEAVLALSGFQLQHPVQLFHPEWMPGTADTHLRPLVRVVSDATGAPGEIVGVVVEARSRQPLAGVQVAVEGTELAVVTDAGGRFRLRNVPPGTRVVRVVRLGFAPVRRTVVVGDDPITELRFDLTPQILLLESVVVTGTAGEVEAAKLPYAIDRVRAQDVPAPPAPPPADGAGGGQDAGIALRTNFDALALWAPVVRTDADGRARVPFDLPSSLTRYRVMAVAVSGGTLYGMDESSLTARQPLMVRPSAPRFLNYGDRFELPVVVQNQTDAPVTVDVAARGAGIGFAEGGRRVTIPANDRVEVRLSAQALWPGTARIQVAAVGGTMSDAAEITLPVYTPATAEAFATYGSIADDGAVELPLDVPGDAIPAFGGLEVTTSSTALQELTDAFLYLVRYPYECAEQIASRLLAVAALRDVMAEFRAEGLPPAEALADSVARDLKALQGMQRGDGGFSFWSGDDRESWPYVSLHVTHALLRARARGYPLPQGMLERALDYTRTIDTHIPAEYPQDTRFALRAYAAYVLDRADDEAARGHLTRLFDGVRADTIRLEVAGWLLTAVADRREFAEERAELLRIVNNRATETASTATFATRYQEGEYLLLHSERRTDAIVLEALLAADPRNPLVTKTVRGLLGHRTAGRWDNTQENSWVLLALDRYFREYEAQTPEFVARVWLGERFAGEERFTGRSADRGHLDVPMRVLVGDDPSSLTIGKEGPGRLYYRAGLRYAPRDLDLAPLERGFAVERTYEAMDDTADVVRGPDGEWRVKAGARVRVTVTMTAPSRRVHVAMVDPLPAGFEAINPALRGAESTPRGDAGRMPWSMADDWWWWGPWYQHQNLRDDRVEAFTTLLPAGVFTYSYVARATTPGTFVVPPPRAEEMYSPETFGRGSTERVIVVPDEGQ